MIYVSYQYDFCRYKYFVKFESLEKANQFLRELALKVNVVFMELLEREPTKQELSGK